MTRLVLFAASLSVVVVGISAQPPASVERFMQVKGWTGTFTMTTAQSGSGKYDNGTSTWRLDSSSHGTVQLDEIVDADDYSYEWQGAVDGTLSVNHTNRFVMGLKDPCIADWSSQGTYPISVGGNGTPIRPRLVIRHSQGTYDFGFVPSSVRVDRNQKGVCLKIPHNDSRQDAESFYQSASHIPIPATGLTLSGASTLKAGKPSTWPEMFSGTAPVTDYDVNITWNLTPTLEDLELVVEPEGYESWRPEAGPDEGSIGNEITINAKLQRTGGSAPDKKARTIIFELSGTSREPGVALNFPVESAATKDFDLQFSPRSNPPGRYIISGPGHQRAETLPGQHTSASIVVSSFDWGAWSAIKVTAELEDGRIVTGHLTGSKATTDILLPKRATDSHIADSWKQNAGATLPDDDDSDPGAAGNDNLGDGFTLYEEYRGFHANGHHVSGDARKIDFFVRNYVGADAQSGIDLFADLTGAQVYVLTDDGEFDPEKRVMNVNHASGAHLVDQHGVFVQTKAGLNGAETIFSQAGVAGRPANTIRVDVQPRNSVTEITTSENVPLSDLAFAYDRAIVHELMHAIGAEHHGTGNDDAAFQFLFADDFKNKTGKAHYEYLPDGPTVTIQDEVTGRDLATLREPDLILMREQWRPLMFPGILKPWQELWAKHPNYDTAYTRPTAEQMAERYLNNFFSRPGSDFKFGAEHGQSSGNELCVMRYYFARLYKKSGTADTFYYVSNSRTERAGLEICRRPAGTGINDKARKPQPRYGDAGTGLGNCAESLVFNDAIAPTNSR